MRRRNDIIDMQLSAISGLSQERPAHVVWPVALAVSVLSPVVLSLAFPTVNLSIFAFIAFVPLFLFWSKASWKQALWWGWLAGTVMFMLLDRWMMHSIGDFVGSWSIVALILLSAYEGAFIAIAAVCVALAARGTFDARTVFAAPAALLLLETARTRGSLGVPFGELGLVSAHMPWLLPLAGAGGVYLLTGIIALVNGALAGIIGGTTGGRQAGAAALGIVVVAVVVANITSHRVTLAPPSLRVAIAQGNISQRDKWTPAVFERTIVTYSQLTAQAAARGAKVVVWPETAVTSFPLQEPALLARLARVAKSHHIYLMAGTVDRPTDNGYYNSLLAIAPDGSVVGIYHKRYLVPFAEYLPLDSVLRRIPLLDVASRFLSGPGPHLLDAAGFRFGTLICYESAFAPYARATANAGADSIIVATDDAWFGGTNGPYQHADASVIDAVSTGRWIVRGADTGVSEIIDPKGNIIAQLGLDEQGVVVGDIGRALVTAYDRFGILWLLLAALAALIAGLWRTPQRAPGWRSRRGAW